MKDSVTAAKNLVLDFGISYDQSFDIIEDSLVRGATANGEYMDSLNEYGVFFQKAGYSAKEFSDIINAGFDLGVYSDKHRML